MIDRLVIPDNAIKYILLQRTAYLRFPVTRLYRLFNRFLPFHTPLYNIVVAGESRIGTSRIKRLYADDMRQEYLSIKQFLPQKCSSVLDIGCGVAGIDVFIHRHYAGQAVRFYLLDKTYVEKNVFYLYQPQGAFYNSLDVAQAMLVGNGISEHCVHLLEANDRGDLRIDAPVDLIVSLISWGFHYPVSTYVDKVHDLLCDDGVVILDVRKGTDGIDVLRRTFQHVDVICEQQKQYRVAARKM